MGKKENLLTGEKKELTGKEKTQFKKGTSGNPSGRPKKTPEQIAQDKQIEGAANKAISMIAGDLPFMTEEIKRVFYDPATPASVKTRIWEASMDRVYGKAFQSVQIDTGANDVSVSIEEPAEDLAK